VFFLELEDHLAGGLAEELVEELGGGVGFWDGVVGEDFVDYVGGGFDGDGLGGD